MTQIAKAQEQEIKINIGADQTTLVTFPDENETVVAFGPEGDVTLYTDQPVQPAHADPHAATGPLLSILDSFNAASLNGAKVDALADRFVASVTNGTITIKPPSAAPGYVKKLKIGEEVNGAIFGGYSPETGKALLVDLTDAGSPMSFRKARRLAKRKARKTGKNVRLPTAWESKTIFNNLAAAGIGGFKDDNYWTSSSYHYSCGCIKFVNFKDGLQDNGPKRKKHSVRFIHD